MAVILIIEDEINIRLFVTANLEARGYEVLEAGTGQEGLQMMRGAAPGGLILDVLLPDMTGWDVLRTMSEDQKLKDIPVILMTASVSTPQLDENHYANVVERLVKPASVNELIEAVRRVVPL